MKEIRCIVCRKLFNHDELINNKGCPVCGYQGLTMLTNGDINIDINWFELRLICMWSEAMVLEIGDTHSINAFYGVIKAIKDQLPDAGRITMFDQAPELDDITQPVIDRSGPPDGTLMN
mgnify:CR=1 FL=1